MSGARAPAVAALAALLALLAAGAAGPVTGGAATAAPADPTFQVFVPQPTLQPGQPNELRLQLVNEAEDPDERVETARAVRASLHADGTPLSVQSGTTRLGPMPDGQPAELPFVVDVPFDVPGGTYELTLRVQFEDDGDRRTQRVPVEVRIEDRPLFEIASVDADVDVGESGTVAVTVENAGSEPAREASVTLQSTNAQVTFGGSASASRFVGTVAPGETATVEFGVAVAPGADRQTYAVQATVSFVGPDGRPGQSRGLRLGFTPGPEQEFALEGVEGTLRVGEEGTLRGTVTNEGADPVRDVVVMLRTTSPTVTIQEVEFPVGRLGPGEAAPVRFDVEVSEAADAGPRRFTFVVEYRTAGGERRQGDPLDARVRVRPASDVFDVEGVSTAVTAGGATQLRLRVTNRRNETLRDVSAKLFVDDPLSSDDDRAFAGTLEPGESATIAFSLAAAGTAMAKSYPVEVDFQYRTPDGDTRLSDTYTVAVTVRRREGGGLPLPLPLPLPVVVGAVAIAALVVTAGIAAWRRL